VVKESNMAKPERPEDKVGSEIFRLMKIAKESAPEAILDEALQGRTPDVETLTRLMKFVRDSFGPGEFPSNPALGSAVTRKFTLAVRSYLENAGIDERLTEQIVNPPQPKGCVLDEFQF
jgi:hypothetical protein